MLFLIESKYSAMSVIRFSNQVKQWNQAQSFLNSVKQNTISHLGFLTYVK